MKEEEIQDELVSIRKLMERSSKFISLSGLSGILAGVYALIGAALAYTVISENNISPYRGVIGFFEALLKFESTIIYLLLIALIVLLASITTGILLSIRKAKKNNQPIWSKTSKAMLFHLATPLLTGGILILIFISRGYFGIISPLMLVFYGLALISAGNFTFNYIKYLGLCEIVLGLIAACLPGYGLLFWAIGFGLLHIIYGSMVYFKYDR